MRKRSLSVLQQQPQPPLQAQQLLQRRLTSLRELSLNLNKTYSSILPSNLSPEYDYEYGVMMMSPSASLQRMPAPLLKRHSLASSSTIDRSGTPTTGNVFARLSQTPTRASQAKISHRHSSSSMDELRLKWEYERTPSAMSGAYQDE
ncbi:hypothetical protein G6F68_018578 [Rhizopus microsporus]|nr:hypothetical protein G6F68_018578 [Rhizopus microsporus]